MRPLMSLSIGVVALLALTATAPAHAGGFRLSISAGDNYRRSACYDNYRHRRAYYPRHRVYHRAPVVVYDRSYRDCSPRYYRSHRTHRYSGYSRGSGYYHKRSYVRPYSRYNSCDRTVIIRR